MKIKLIIENSENITFENNIDQFEDIVRNISQSNWYGLGNFYINVKKIVRIERIEDKEVENG